MQKGISRVPGIQVRKVKSLSKVRIRNKNLLHKVVSPAVAAGAIESGMTIGAAGGLYSGFPKTFFKALAERGRKGEVKDLGLWGVSLFGKEIEGLLAEAGVLKRRLGSHGDRTLRECINAGKVQCNDIRTEMLPQFVGSRFFKKVDVAVVDAVGVTEEGHIIPSHTPADIGSHIRTADLVIVEINHAQPVEWEGFHDIYIPELPPRQKEIPIYRAGDRIGTPYVSAGEEKITYIIESHYPEKNPPLPVVDESSQKLAEHLIDFFKNEVRSGRLPGNLLPLETGIGSIADAFLRCLAGSDFTDLEIYTGALGDGVIELIDSGRCKVASGGGIFFSENTLAKIYNNFDYYREKLIIRSAEVTNHPEVIRRLGLIALNAAIEVDIYGHINSSHIGGTHLVNGVGGSSVFAANGYLSIFLALSTGKGGAISTVVPMVSHVDNTEHFVDIVVTEQGLADLRGLSPQERAAQIIDNCAHPAYRPALYDYFAKAKDLSGGHEPHLLPEAFSFHERLKQTGSMIK